MRRLQGGQAPAEHDALEPPVLAELLALVVQALADAQAAVVRVDAHLHAVELVAVGIVPGGVARRR